LFMFLCPILRYLFRSCRTNYWGEHQTWGKGLFSLPYC